MSESMTNTRRRGADLPIRDKDLTTGKDVRRLVAEKVTESNEIILRGLRRIEEKYDAEFAALRAERDRVWWRRLARWVRRVKAPA